MPNSNEHGPQSSADPVALLLRVSSEEQRDRETIEIQREFLKEYCRLYGLEVAETYADDGVSGTIPLHERPDGRRLLADAQEGKFTTLLVYRLDRLGRSLLVIVDAAERLEAAGVSLRSATEPIDTSTPSGRLIFQMLASFAEYERETIAERTRAGFHRALRNGKFPGRLPYGYRLSPDERGLEIVEEEAAVVREIVATSQRVLRFTLKASASTMRVSRLRGGATRAASANTVPHGHVQPLRISSTKAPTRVFIVSR